MIRLWKWAVGRVATVVLLATIAAIVSAICDASAPPRCPTGMPYGPGHRPRRDVDTVTGWQCGRLVGGVPGLPTGHVGLRPGREWTVAP